MTAPNTAFLELTAADGATISAYHVRPEGKPRGGLVVIQEIFGVNDHIRRVAEGYARDGYEVIAPALFDRIERGVELGYDQDGMTKGRALAGQLGWDKPLADIAAAAKKLASAGKVGVVGYCWGGSLAFLAATRLEGLSAAVGYYGSAIAKHASERPKVPTLLHFGAEDKGIPLEDVEQVRSARPEVGVHVYEAGHGFNCDVRGSYHEPSSTQARARTLAFFAQHVG